MSDILAELENRRAEARLGGGQHRIDAQHAKGKTDGEGAYRNFIG